MKKFIRHHWTNCFIFLIPLISVTNIYQTFTLTHTHGLTNQKTRILFIQFVFKWLILSFFIWYLYYISFYFFEFFHRPRPAPSKSKCANNALRLQSQRSTKHTNLITTTNSFAHAYTVHTSFKLSLFNSVVFVVSEIQYYIRIVCWTNKNCI